MGKTVRHDSALSALLQTVVADSLRGIQRFLGILFIQNLPLLHAVAPYAGETVRL